MKNPLHWFPQKHAAYSRNVYKPYLRCSYKHAILQRKYTSPPRKEYFFSAKKLRRFHFLDFRRLR